MHLNSTFCIRTDSEKPSDNSYKIAGLIRRSLYMNIAHYNEYITIKLLGSLSVDHLKCHWVCSPNTLLRD